MIISGWSYGEAFDKARKEKLFEIQENSSDKQNLIMLSKGRLDLVVALEISGSLIIRKEKLSEKIKVLKNPIKVSDTFVVFAKDKKQLDLIKRFNKALEAIKDDGTFQKIYNSFIGN